MEHMVIAVGRRYGSGGHEIGERLAKRLGIPFYDRELVEMASKKSGIAQGVLEIHNERAVQATLLKTKSGSGGQLIGELLFQLQSQIIRELAEESSCVIIGRCANYVLRDRADLFSVFVTAPEEKRVQRIMERNRMCEEDARYAVKKVDRQRREYYDHYTEGRWGEMEGYDLMVDSSILGIDGTAELLEEKARAFAACLV